MSSVRTTPFINTSAKQGHLAAYSLKDDEAVAKDPWDTRVSDDEEAIPVPSKRKLVPAKRPVIVDDDDDDEESEDNSFDGHSSEDDDDDEIDDESDEVPSAPPARKCPPLRAAMDVDASDVHRTPPARKVPRKLSAAEEAELARKAAKKAGWDMKTYDQEEDPDNVDACGDDDDDEEEYRQYLRNQGADDDAPDAGIVRSNEERICEALKGLVEMSETRLQKIMTREIKKTPGMSSIAARVSAAADALEETFESEPQDDEEEAPAYKLIKPMLAVIEKQYVTLPENLASLARFVMGSVMTSNAAGAASMSTDNAVDVSKTDFWHLRKALFDKLKERTKSRMCSQFFSIVSHTVGTSNTYELRAVKNIVNLGLPRASDPFACVLCDEDVPLRSPEDNPLMRYVTAVEIAQHKSSTLKSKAKVTSPQLVTPHGSLGETAFVMCHKCISCVKLFNAVILAERHVQWLAQCFLKHHATSSDPGSIINAFHQWDVRVLWANSVAVAFKMLHAPLID